MDLLRWSTRDGITELFFEQPEKRNPLDLPTKKAFTAALKSIAKEKSKILVLSGSGGAFSAGGDLDFLEANSHRRAAQNKKTMIDFYSSFLKLRSLPQVTIAKINGPAVGAGLCLALACDMRSSLRTAKCGFNFVRIGLNPGMGAWPLGRAVLGEARARELLMRGCILPASEFFGYTGAVSAWADTGIELDERTDALAREVAANSGTALRALKAEIGLGDDLAKYLRAEATGQARCFAGPDLLEGIASIREKRAPNFQG